MALDTGLPEEPRHAPEGMQRGTRERVPLAKIVRKDRRNFISFVLHAHILRSSLRAVCQNRNYAARAKKCASLQRRSRMTAVASATLFADARFSLAWSLPPVLRRDGKTPGKRFGLCWQRPRTRGLLVRPEQNPQRRNRSLIERCGRGTGRRRAEAVRGLRTRSLTVRRGSWPPGHSGERVARNRKPGGVWRRAFARRPV